MFRISRSNYDKIYNLLLQDNAYFRPGIDAVGREKIDPHCKVLMGLKVLAYGVSPGAFSDYFQMGKSTGQDCLKELTSTISNNEELRLQYFLPI